MPINRRQFILGGLGAGAAGLVLSRQSPGPRPGGAAVAAPGKDGILVLLTLYGGNDGLNTVIPYESGSYLGGRSALGYQPDQILPLSEGLGLHPNLRELKGLWDAKRLAIVRGVGYPNPDRSHFRSMDIWQSGVPDSQVVTGWVGRWLDVTGSDPLRALSVGGSLPRVFGGEKAAGAAVPVGELSLPGTPALRSAFAPMAAPSAGASPLAARVAQSGKDLLAVDDAIAHMLAGQPSDDEATGSTSLEGTGGANSLTPQLELVAQLVKAGSPTRVDGVSLGGFDTHANEKETHARLMGDVDEAVGAFFKSLEGSPQGARVVLVAYSEFGRRVAANGSRGDRPRHGGAGVRGGHRSEGRLLRRRPEPDRPRQRRSEVHHRLPIRLRHPAPGCHRRGVEGGFEQAVRACSLPLIPPAGTPALVRCCNPDRTQEYTRRLMYEHSCSKAGAAGCGYVVRANSEEDLKTRVIEHARRKHGVQGMTDTIYTYLRDTAKKS